MRKTSSAIWCPSRIIYCCYPKPSKISRPMPENTTRFTICLANDITVQVVGWSTQRTSPNLQWKFESNDPVQTALWKSINASKRIDYPTWIEKLASLTRKVTTSPVQCSSPGKSTWKLERWIITGSNQRIAKYYFVIERANWKLPIGQTIQSWRTPRKHCKPQPGNFWIGTSKRLDWANPLIDCCSTWLVWNWSFQQRQWDQ